MKDSDRAGKVLATFYKTVDVMKSAHNQPDKLMSIWESDIKAIEGVVSFLENLRDRTQ